MSGPPIGARGQWRERVAAVAALVLAGLLCWQAAGVLLRDRDRERAGTGVAAEWIAEVNDVHAMAEFARQRELAGDAAGVVGLTRRIVARRPLDAVNRLRLALALAAQGEHELARLHTAHAARIARNHPELLLHCGTARLRAWDETGDLAALRDGLNHYRDALERDVRLLGRVRAAMGSGPSDDPEGIAGAANLLQLVPARPDAWREAARVFTAAGDWEAAAEAHRRAGSAGEERAVEALARAHAEARAGRAAVAVAVVGQAVELARPDERLRVIRSAVHLLRTLPAPLVPRGEALCAAWAKQWPEAAVVSIELAEWRLHRGDVAGALEVIASLDADTRDDPAVLDLRGRTAAAAGRPGVAETYYRRALRGQREQPARWLRLIHWLEGRGRIDDALALADQAQQRHPAQAAIAATRDRLLSKSVGVPPEKSR